MLKTPPRFRNVVSLVPRSCVQFLDFGLNLEAFAKTNRAFWEEAKGSGPDVPVVLRFLFPDEKTRDLVDSETGRVGDPQTTYSINARKAVEVYNGRWMPLPYLRVRGKAADGRDVFADGPTNWARLRIVELPDPDRDGNSHRATLAFDTDIRARRKDGPYLVPTPADVSEEQEFALAAGERDNSWFLDLPWVDEWLEEGFRDYKQALRGDRPLRDEDFPYACEHWARYLTMLQLLADAKLLPRIKLVDTETVPAKYTPIDVDLVLDVGNSRTCGILIESYRDAKIDLNNSYVLELRDLSQPEMAYQEPFMSRLEFARASFGNDNISRRSGRNDGFLWPTPARVGPEAARLAAKSQGTEGSTGMSSPKRYLWDERPRNQDWRFNAKSLDGKAGETPVAGKFVQFVTENGYALDDPKGNGKPAQRPRFCRSSLMTFALSEIVLQALVMINSPAHRGQRSHADAPRQLRRIIMTMPTAMPLAEQRILKRRAEDAVKLTWEAMGWISAEATIGPPPPKVQLNWDEASCTQLVYLYTELTQKFLGDFRAFFGILGHRREGHGKEPSLRIASLDIGGGTTDLIVTTYELESDRAINPKQNFREGFNIAGDDILLAVVERHVLPVVAAGLKAAGLDDPQALMSNLVGANRGGQSEQERNLRKQFAIQVGMPIALDMIRSYETADLLQGNRVFQKKFGEFFAPDRPPSAAVIAYLERAAAEAGAVGFRLAGLDFEVNMAAIDHTVRGVIGQVLADLCEIVNLYDCDVLLLSGRPSVMPAVKASILAKLPVPADRIQPMHRYRVGSWYPFRDPHARIDDPKTTAVVGAMLCSLAEGQIEALLLRSSRMAIKSTARFIGEMEITGQIRKSKVFFAGLNLDDPKARPPEHKFDFYAPIFIGFRQLDVERWPATPLYRLEFANPQDARRMALPLKVQIERAEIDEDSPDKEARREDFRITEIEDNEGDSLRPSDVSLRLQTLKDEEGYWLDTGVFTIS